MNRRVKRERVERLADQVQACLELKELAENVVVQRWFANERERLLLQIQEYATHDGDQCRMHAIELRILNRLEQTMRGVIARGEKAAEDLAKMDSANG